MLRSLLRVGDRAPNFRLLSNRGEWISLDDFLGRSNVVLYFYPKDRSIGCTKEACSFRDSYSVFRELGAEILGISSDNQESHREFANAKQLPFPLLTDSDGSVRRAFNVGPTLRFIPGRTTFVIDKQGIIRHIHSSQIHPESHVEEALRALRSLI